MFKFALSTSLLTVFVVTAAQAANQITEVTQTTLICHETGTGSDVDLEINEIQRVVKFENGGSQSGTTLRAMELRVANTRAESVDQSPNLANVPIHELTNAFLKKNTLSRDGSQYISQSTFYDKYKAQYPAALLRLKVAIPKDLRRTRNGQTESHLSINMVMPESRLQNGKFMASGYVGYYLEGNRENAEFTIGLASLECQKTILDLGQDPCLTKEDRKELNELEAELQQAMKADPGCENPRRREACLSPLKEVILRSLKDRTICK